MEKVIQRSIDVALGDNKTVLLIVRETNEKTGEVVTIRTSALSPSAALELGFKLQKVCEDLLQQHGEEVERIGGRHCRDVKSTGV